MRLVGEIVKQVRGVTYKKSQAISELRQGYKPVLRAGNIIASRILESDFVYVPQNIIKDDRLLKYGDILIAASSGSLSVVGKAAMLESDMNAGFGAFCKVLRPNKEVIFPRYFKFFFETAYYKNTIKHLAEGANINNLKTEHFNELQIPLPPLPEQQKIAAILDAADKLRQKDQQLIEQYNALSQSLFLDMFGDLKHNHKNFEITTIGEVISKIKDGPHVSPKYSDEGIPILSTRNIRPFSLILNELKYVSIETYEILTRRFLPQKGDVLLTKGGTTGYAKIVDFDWKFCIWVHIAALRPKTNLIRAKYLEAALNSHYCYYQSQLLTKGIANKYLGLKRIVNIVLLLPPLALQNQFAERIQAIEAQKQQAQASLKKSDDLFNSLLKRAFKAELNG